MSSETSRFFVTTLFAVDCVGLKEEALIEFSEKQESPAKRGNCGELSISPFKNDNMNIELFHQIFFTQVIWIEYFCHHPSFFCP